MDAGQTVAGKYRLNHPLGSGGMASVWSATNVFTEREFAIKFMLPQVARTPDAARRFLLEAKVSGRINHPNVIEMIDVGQAEDGSLFLVMELLSGMSLDAVLRGPGAAMRVHELVLVMRQIAGALSAVHARGVIHRDLKPTNIFLHVDRSGGIVPKLLDFGVSKVLQDDGDGSLTAVGTILGSPLYMSPEQAMGEPGIDVRTDVFAFGSILFEALCGERAYDAASLNALIVAIAMTPPKDIDALAPRMPASLRALIRDCMIRDRAARPASFDDVGRRLDAILPELEASDLRLAFPSAPAEPRMDASRAAHAKRSDHPPPHADTSASAPPVSIPAGAFVFTPRSAASAREPLRPRSRRTQILRSMVGIAAVATVVAVAAGLVRDRTALLTMSSVHPRPAATETRVAAAAPEATASASASTSDVPTVAVDALPVASAAPVSRARLAVRPAAATASSASADAGSRTAPWRDDEPSASAHPSDGTPPAAKPRP